MQKRSLELVTGVFILIGIGALLLLALRVSGLTIANDSKFYKIYAHFDNISGLNLRSKVSIAGVTIGKVVAIELDTENYKSKVTMEIDEKVNQIPTDSIISILTAGLLGEKYIGISLGGDTELVEDGGSLYDTQSSVVLEDLIGKVLSNFVSSKSDSHDKP